VFHTIIAILFFLWKIDTEFEVSEFVTIGFGSGNSSSSGGILGKQGLDLPQQESSSQIIESEKKVDLPVVKNSFEENIAINEENNKNKNKTGVETNNQNLDTKQGNLGQSEGGLGFDIEWGGSGTRKIYSYILPEYPVGVNKELDIRLRFSILPDGSVGIILPLTKGDTRMENAAINSLRQWKFEPLGSSKKQVEQFAVIVFPYRLQ
jgi:protein TonB